MSVEYSFTITLQKKMYRFVAEDQYDMTYVQVRDILRSLSPNITLVAELTSACNVHFHGIIKFVLAGHNLHKNLRKVFTDAFRNHKEIGFTYIKQITDMGGWELYIMKSVLETRSALVRPPVIIDSFNCLRLIPDTLDGMIQDNVI